MLVYVLHMDGRPLMPTRRCGKVRRLLDSGRAVVVRRCPFTVRLLYPSGTVTQPVDLGVDAGSRMAGLSACTEERELYAGEVMLRTDVTKKLSDRRELRRGRRYRKHRYRAPRFANRVKAKKKGWLAPTVQVKINAHIKAVEDVLRILPVTSIIVETAAFDIQKIQALRSGKAAPEGRDYQHGPQLGFWNVREYVLWRDGHTCRCCGGKSKDPVLNVHHIESRKTGGDSPDNLVTLCRYCHRQYHEGRVSLPASVRRGPGYRHAAFMGIMRWAFYGRLKALRPGMVSMTYGYITKNTRIQHRLEKTHAVDARCISGHPEAESLGCYYLLRKVRRHNRQLHKTRPARGGLRRSNQSPREVKGFRLFDCVRFHGEECFVFGRRSSGYFDLRKADGTKVHASAPWRELRLLEHSGTTLKERRPA